MEEQKRRINLAGILRFLLGVLIVIIVAFLLVRFITLRQDNNKAQEVAQQASKDSESKQDSDSSSDSSDEQDQSTDQSANGSDSSKESGDTSTEIPSGVADSSQDSNISQTNDVPATGMGESIVYLAFMLGFAVFVAYEGALLVKNHSRT